LEMGESKDFLKALGFFMGGGFCLFLVVLFVLTIVHRHAKCPSEILGGEEAVGARIYINGKYVGVMEEHQKYADISLPARICVWFDKEDQLRAEKEGYQTLTTKLDPFFNDSRSPPVVSYIELTPLEGTPPGDK
jgi:hypothetical protein